MFQLIQKATQSLRSIVKPPTLEQHVRRFGCDGCGKIVEHPVDVYHCMSCENLDFCSECFQLYGNLHSHDGIAMVKRERGTHLMIDLD